MKKLLYFAVAALAFVACAKEMTPEKEEVKETPKVKVSIKAVLAQEPETKAEIDMSNGSGSWVKDDEIAVYTKKGNWATLKAESDGSSVTFSGEIDEGDEIEDGAVAFYPASITINGNTAKVNLPSSYSSASEAAKGFLLRGVLTGDAVVFNHIGALLKVTINDIPESVTALELSAASKAITGQLNVVQEGENPFYCAAGAGSNDNRTITIATTAAERTSSATVFCIPMPVGTYTNGFSIILKAGSTVAATKTSTNNVIISRAKVVKMKAFTPEEASGWFVAGGFNRWSTTATAMTAVEGHDGWLVAKNIDVTPVDGQNAGFKLYNGAWKGSNGADLHTQYDGADEANSGNITPANGKYDIYFNPGANKYFIAEAGESWNTGKVIYLMSDMELSDQQYYLHVWPHSGSGMTSTWPGIVCEGAETISGIKYYKFPIAICDGNFAVNSYDCIFHNSSDSVRYDFLDGVFTTDSVNNEYYLSFTGKEYNKGVEGTTFGSGKTNPMTQFSDPAKPEGNSYWGFFNPSADKLLTMHWDSSPELVVKNVAIGPDTEFKLCFNWKSIFFGPDAALVNPEEVFTVSRSNTNVFSVDLDDDYVCDLYLNIFDKTARIVPIAKSNITLFFNLVDIALDPVYFYTFGSWYIHDWPGVEIEQSVFINNSKFYKIEVPAEKIWDQNVNLIISGKNTNNSSWQTNDFTTADWSGRKNEYYFKVEGKDIVQLSGRPGSPSAIDGVFSDWSDIAATSYTSGSTGHITSMKGYSDGQNLWLYLNLTPGTGTYKADGWRYFRLYFDRDNNAGTGFNTDHWFYGGADNISEGITNICVFYSKDGFGNAAVRNQDDSETISGSSIKAVDNGTSGIEVELKMPLSAIGTITGTLINIFAVGDCGSEFDGKITGVYVPSIE